MKNFTKYDQSKLSLADIADIAEIEQTAHQKRQKKITKQGNKRERKGKGQK